MGALGRGNRHSFCLAGLTSGGATKSARKSRGLGAHLKVSGDEAGERKLVDVGREGPAGPDGNFGGHGLGDAPIQGVVTAWGERREAAQKGRGKAASYGPPSLLLIRPQPSPRAEGSSAEPRASQRGTAGADPPHGGEAGGTEVV